ncbi:MAG: PKD domain-containing protein, partial [Polyangiales bacterium]
MSLTRSSLWLGYALAAFVVLGGCGETTSPDSGGSLALDLVLADGAEIDRVDWRITREGMAPMEGSIDTSAPGSTASVEVYGLPPGQGSSLDLDATSDDGETTCKGSMNFNVSIGQITEAFVMLQCKTAPDSGGLRVETEVNLCGELIKVVVSPLQTSIGNQIDLSAAAVNDDGDPISYFWSASGGPITNPTAPQTTYTCAQAGQQFVRIQVSDAENCVDEWTVPVRCVSGGGTGGAGGTGATGGTGGTAGTGGGGCQQSCGLGNS